MIAAWFLMATWWLLSRRFMRWLLLAVIIAVITPVIVTAVTL